MTGYAATGGSPAAWAALPKFLADLLRTDSSVGGGSSSSHASPPREVGAKVKRGGRSSAHAKKQVGERDLGEGRRGAGARSGTGDAFVLSPSAPSDEDPAPYYCQRGNYQRGPRGTGEAAPWCNPLLKATAHSEARVLPLMSLSTYRVFQKVMPERGGSLTQRDLAHPFRLLKEVATAQTAHLPTMEHSFVEGLRTQREMRSFKHKSDQEYLDLERKKDAVKEEYFKEMFVARDEALFSEEQQRQTALAARMAQLKAEGWERMESLRMRRETMGLEQGRSGITGRSSAGRTRRSPPRAFGSMPTGPAGSSFGDGGDNKPAANLQASQTLAVLPDAAVSGDRLASSKPLAISARSPGTTAVPVASAFTASGAVGDAKAPSLSSSMDASSADGATAGDDGEGRSVHDERRQPGTGLVVLQANGTAEHSLGG